jgi:hypothetical protein
MVVPPAKAVGDGVSGPPLMTVTSGLAVALGVATGASTHLVTFSPPAATLVVHRESCAKATGATSNAPTIDNKATNSNFLTVPLSPGS